MTCVRVDSKTIMCFNSVYEMYRGGKCYLFEWHNYCGPTELRKSDHEPKKRNQKGFWDVVEEFRRMTPEDQEHYRI